MGPEVTIIEIHSALEKTDGASLSTVKRRAKREAWPYRKLYGKGRGGREKLYISSLLPADVKAVLQAVSVSASESSTSDCNKSIVQKTGRLPGLEAHKEQVLFEAQEKKAYAKTELAKEYVSRMSSAGYGEKSKLRRMFFENYNLGEQGLMPAVFKVIGKVDMRGKTVGGWIKKLRENNWNPLCLVDKRGYFGRGKRAVTQEQMKIILSIVQSPYNVPGKPIIEIIHQAKDIMVKRGINTLSDSTYRRWLTKDWIPYNYDKWIWWREGDKGLNDKVLYNLLRDYDKLESGDLLVADGHILNFEILNPFTGKPKRMMLVLFYDFKSSYPLGWEIMPSENTESISVALRRAILRLGRIPIAVYLDNGRAFKGKYFINNEKAEELKGLYGRLGIKCIIATPYHGQSKPIERFFGTFAELERWAPSYVGTSINNKPAHMNRGEKLRRQLHMKITNGAVPTLEEAHRAIGGWFDKYVDTKQTASSHLAGQKPADVLVTGPGVDPVALRCLMMKSEKRLIRRNGINLHGQWYYDPKLYGRKHYVYCRYDLASSDSVLVYDEKTEEYICEAFKVSKVHPMVSITGTEADKAEYKRQIEMKMRSRKQTVSTARQIIETQVIPESRKRIEAAGFTLSGAEVNNTIEVKNGEVVKDKPEKLQRLTKEEKEAIRKQARETDFDFDDLTGQNQYAGACDAAGMQSDDGTEYVPEVVCENEVEQAWALLKTMSEFDRFEKLIELETRGSLIPNEYKAWMMYFENTAEYRRNKEYFDEYRIKLVLEYGNDKSEKTGTEN